MLQLNLCNRGERRAEHLDSRRTAGFRRLYFVSLLHRFRVEVVKHMYSWFKLKLTEGHLYTLPVL